MTDDFFVTVDGVRLACQKITPPEARPGAPVIVFLHEALGSIRMWRDFPKKLATATGYPVLVYERRGHGRSDPHTVIPRPIDFHNEESDRFLHGLLTALAIKKPILFGHSDGATIALKYAARFPDNVCAVISEAAHVVVEDVTVAGITEAAKTYAETDWKLRLERHHFDQTDDVVRAWIDTWTQPAFRDWDMTGDLAAIICPMLVIQGETDQFGSIRQVNLICDHSGGPATPLILANCGHIPHLEQPDAVIAASTVFLDGLSIT
ncbi:MAG: alpha/beta hydrolase [Pseudomonadota bacterium]